MVGYGSDTRRPRGAASSPTARSAHPCPIAVHRTLAASNRRPRAHWAPPTHPHRSICGRRRTGHIRTRGHGRGARRWGAGCRITRHRGCTLGLPESGMRSADRDHEPSRPPTANPVRPGPSLGAPGRHRRPIGRRDPLHLGAPFARGPDRGPRHPMARSIVGRCTATKPGHGHRHPGLRRAPGRRPGASPRGVAPP